MAMLEMAETLGRRIEAAFGMTDEVWERHANPWSGYTRFAILPLLTLAIWSRVWIGWWALAPIAIVLAWTWANPRAFPPPARTDGWMSKAVFGERVWLNRREVEVPRRHADTMNALTLLSAVGVPPYIYGLWAYDPPMTIFGGAFAVLAKFWFLDRCVWLYEDMAARHEPYRRWLRPRSETI